MREITAEEMEQEKLRQVFRTKMETTVRLLQRVLNHECLSDSELDSISDGCNWVWQWAANVEREGVQR